MARRRPGIAFSLFMIAFGVVFIAINHSQNAGDRPYDDGVPAVARLSDVTSDKNSSNVAWYRGTYTFTTGDGKEVSVPGRSTVDAESQLAREVTVSYRAADPPGARIIPETDYTALIMYCAGGLVVLAGLGYLLRALLQAVGRSRR